MSSEKFLERVYGWHERANKEDDYFVKFIFDYLAFVALISYNNNDNKPDRQLIQELKQKNQIKNEYYSKMDINRIEKLIKILKVEPITNNTNMNDKWWDCEKDNCSNIASPNDGKLHSHNDYPNIVEFIYRARNNLFHGQKGLDFRRDSLIVEYGFYLLNPLVDILINKINE